MRADEIGLLSEGAPSLTPVIDKAFEKGFIFKNAYSSYGWTNMASALFESFDNKFLAPLGYDYLSPLWPSPSYWVPTPKNLVKNPIPVIEQYTNEFKTYYSELKKMLLRPRQKPFIIFVHTKYLHYPYIDSTNENSNWDQYLSDVEKKYAIELMSHPEKYPLDLPAPLILKGSSNILEKFPHWRSDAKSSMLKFNDQYHLFSDVGFMGPWRSSINYKKDLEIIRKVYRAKLHYLDHELKDILNLYGDPNLQENTVIILTGDHGESLMEHNILGHAANIYDEVMRFPLMVKFPRSKLTEKVVIHNQFYQGTFKKIMKDIMTGNINEENFYAKVIGDEKNKKIIMRNCENTIQGVRSNNEWKYIKNYKSGEISLYDLIRDPVEKNDVKKDHPSVAAQLELVLTISRGQMEKITDFSPCDFNKIN